jgi:hypothetical protein
MTAYDSTVDTLRHIKRVAQLLTEASIELIRRANVHDNSKLEEPEKSEFDRVTPRLAASTYGSEEYKGFLADLQVALKHHYANNSHHPEHYPLGIDDMTLFDVLEMFCDWKAAGERHADGNIWKSIEINSKRFNMSPQLVAIFENTAKYLKYQQPEEVPFFCTACHSTYKNAEVGRRWDCYACAEHERLKKAA